MVTGCYGDGLLWWRVVTVKGCGEGGWWRGVVVKGCCGDWLLR